MQSETELKPCPFCGGKAKIKSRLTKTFGVDHRFIACTDCGGQGKGHLFGLPLEAKKEWLAEEWNNRTAIPELRLYRLRAALAAAGEYLEDETNSRGFITAEIDTALAEDLELQNETPEACKLCASPITKAEAVEQESKEAVLISKIERLIKGC